MSPLQYVMWLACEACGILPTTVKSAWTGCDVGTKAMLVAYGQVREEA